MVVRTLAAVVLIGSGWAHGSLSQDEAGLVRAAIAKTGDKDKEACAYSTWREQDESVVEERFDPRAEEEWQLVSVDGKTPTEGQIDDYAPENRGPHPAVLDFESLEYDEFWPIESDPQSLVFGFIPKDEDGDPIDEAVRGRMTIARATNELTAMEVEASGPWSPAAFVKMNRFWQKFALAYDEEVDAVVMTAMDMEIKGRAMGLKRINVALNLRFGAFDCP